jgi:hypothetical protein
VFNEGGPVGWFGALLGEDEGLPEDGRFPLTLLPFPQHAGVLLPTPTGQLWYLL